MTAASGASLRSDEAYWALTGPIATNRMQSCSACRGVIFKGSRVLVREGRKLRFFYHEACFTGDADPRTQIGSSFERQEYHGSSAPRLSSLEGPRACFDADGRELGRAVFKPRAPSALGRGKWSVNERGFRPTENSTAVRRQKSLQG